MRRLVRALLVVIAVLALIAAVVAWRLWTALPTTSGTLAIPGLTQPVTVVRDVDDVPHIRATSEGDAVFALGYIHAQDRLWQMEFQRRIAQGRLSEVLGPATLETDRLFRTVGFQRAARAAFPHLSADGRAVIDRYVAGVNAFLATHHGRQLPVEFALFRFEPEPWRAEDVLGWQKVMGWAMSLNWRDELLRARLIARVGAERAAQLMPANVPNAPVILPDFALANRRTGIQAPRGTAGIDFPSALARASPAIPDFVLNGGSNNWVLAGSRTASRRPLLANDPHLGAQTPGVWYVAHVSGGALDVIGATLPGTPAVAIGHNRRIAWGVTAMLADVEDFFVEHINGRDEAEFDGTWEPMQIVYETIKVTGAPDVPLRVRITRHGPLLSDVIDEPMPLALRWTGLDTDDRTPEAFLKINRAGSWNEFTAAFGDYHLPMLNFVFADVDGNIGYIGPGALPIRDHDGSVPVPGWTGEHEWRGYVPNAELPSSLNPPRGVLSSANNQVVPDSYPYTISTAWEAPYRAARIAALIEPLERATLDDLARVQADQHSAQADRLLPFVLRAETTTPGARSALDMLSRWDRNVRGDSGGAALYETYLATTAAAIFGDDMGDAWSEYAKYPGLRAKALDLLIATKNESWCDDVRTAHRESCEEILGVALEAALQKLQDVQGGDAARWRWDRMNEIWFPHLPLQASAALRPFFSRHLARGGDAFTIDPAMRIRDQLIVSSYRQIIDLSNFDASRFILPLGQSGELLSGRYSNMRGEWDSYRYRPLRFTDAAIDGGARERLTLQPQ